MQDTNPVSTRLHFTVKLAPLPEEKLHLIVQVPYSVAIGLLMYAVVGSRPDIAFAIQTLSQFTARPPHLLRYVLCSALVHSRHTGAFLVSRVRLQDNVLRDRG